MEIIGRAIDINEHLISEMAQPDMEAPKTYRDTFLLLEDLNVLRRDFAEEISKSAGLRNAIVHEYTLMLHKFNQQSGNTPCDC